MSRSFVPPSGGRKKRSAAARSATAAPEAEQAHDAESVRASGAEVSGHRFEDVHVHKDSERAVEYGAKAYTQGHEIHFAPGQWAPETPRGRELLNHELAHVAQQREGRVRETGRVKGVALNDSPVLEAEADAGAWGGQAPSAAMPFGPGQGSSPVSSSSMPIQRTEADGLREAFARYKGKEDLGNWRDVMRVRHEFSEADWSEIVAAYNRGSSGTGLRLRNARSERTSLAQAFPTSSEASSSGWDVGQALDVSGYAEMGQTGLDTVAPALSENPLSDLLHGVAPPIAAVNAARTARQDWAEAQRGYETGNMTHAVRHGIAAAASTVSSGAHSVNTLTGGANPVAQAVSLGGSMVRHAARTPEYLQQGRQLAYDTGLVNTVSNAIANPMETLRSMGSRAVTAITDTVNAVGHAVTHPVETAQAVRDVPSQVSEAVTSTLEDVKDFQKGRQDRKKQ